MWLEEIRDDIDERDKVRAIVTGMTITDSDAVICLKGRFDKNSDKDVTTSCWLFFSSKEHRELVKRVAARKSEVIVYRERIADTEAWSFTYLVNVARQEYIHLMSGYGIGG